MHPELTPPRRPLPAVASRGQSASLARLRFKTVTRLTGMRELAAWTVATLNSHFSVSTSHAKKKDKHARRSRVPASLTRRAFCEQSLEARSKIRSRLPRRCAAAPRRPPIIVSESRSCTQSLIASDPRRLTRSTCFFRAELGRSSLRRHDMMSSMARLRFERVQVNVT